MAQLNYVAALDLEGCTGCKWCDIVCPSRAISVRAKKAYIDEARCIGCTMCVDKCPEDVMWMARREEPLILEIGDSIDEALRAEAAALLEKRGLPPDHVACVCQTVTSLHVAAAVIKGAQDLSDVAAMTGVRGGCGIYCVAPTLRILKAAGRDMTPPKGNRWYDVTLALMDLEGSAHDGGAGAWVREDLDSFGLRSKPAAQGRQS